MTGHADGPVFGEASVDMKTLEGLMVHLTSEGDTYECLTIQVSLNGTLQEVYQADLWVILETIAYMFPRAFELPSKDFWARMKHLKAREELAGREEVSCSAGLEGAGFELL